MIIEDKKDSRIMAHNRQLQLMRLLPTALDCQNTQIESAICHM